ncbi:hypothetical protein D3Z51_00135 [Clostridiaceae bacterium]|nr:hypothetical protein [Clostridiaceae bacterium]RKI16544.1 hypothetical protein D7V81_04775 [bacterium 1XD21-70]
MVSCRRQGGKSQVCLVHLYVLEGAVENVEWNALPEDKQRERKD